jgi:hypothetical protein
MVAAIMRRSIPSCLGAALLTLACGDTEDNRDPQVTGASITASGLTLTTPSSASDPTDSSSPNPTSTSGETGEDSGAASSGGEQTSGTKFDVGSDSTGIDVNPDTGPKEGCQKIDFLFVIDNSGSMGEEQAALAASFNGFITSIENTVMAKDYHIMVVDTDAGNSFFEECLILCSFFPECEGYPCDMLPVPQGCDAMLGTGLTKNPKNQDCGIIGGNRYMIDGQPNLASTFECVAKVGTSGDGSERPMEAMVAAVSTLNGPGGCNEGFLRKDALLVVTFITDEEDNQSNGNPVGWNAALVAAKQGKETSIVVLGLIGDPDQPNPVCTNQAQAAPRLRQFAESFTYGSWGSVCSPDYAPFFDAAVSVIDTACDQFQPPG